MNLYFKIVLSLLFQCLIQWSSTFYIPFQVHESRVTILLNIGEPPQTAPAVFTIQETETYFSSDAYDSNASKTATPLSQIRDFSLPFIYFKGICLRDSIQFLPSRTSLVSFQFYRIVENYADTRKNLVSSIGFGISKNNRHNDILDALTLDNSIDRRYFEIDYRRKIIRIGITPRQKENTIIIKRFTNESIFPIFLYTSWNCVITNISIGNASVYQAGNKEIGVLAAISSIDKHILLPLLLFEFIQKMWFTDLSQCWENASDYRKIECDCDVVGRFRSDDKEISFYVDEKLITLRASDWFEENQDGKCDFLIMLHGIKNSKTYLTFALIGYSFYKDYVVGFDYDSEIISLTPNSSGSGVRWREVIIYLNIAGLILGIGFWLFNKSLDFENVLCLGFRRFK